MQFWWVQISVPKYTDKETVYREEKWDSVLPNVCRKRENSRHSGLHKCCWQFHSSNGCLQRESISFRICTQFSKRIVCHHADPGWVKEVTFMTSLWHFQAHSVAASLTLRWPYPHGTVFQATQHTDFSHWIGHSFFEPLKSYYDNEWNYFLRKKKRERKTTELTFRNCQLGTVTPATPANAESVYSSTAVLCLNHEVLS
jgi:hypothetical protein